MKPTAKVNKRSGNFFIIVLALLTVQTGFGLHPVFAKKLGVGITSNPLIFCMARDVSCSLILCLLALLSDGWHGFPNLRDSLVFLGLGMTGIFVSQVLYLLGVTFIGANFASIFQQLIPVWTTLLTVLVCIEPVPSFKRLSTWLRLVGLVFAVAGAVEMSLFHSASQFSTDSQYSWLGFVFFIIEALLKSVYIISQKRFIFEQPENQWRNHSIWVIAWSYLSGSVLISLSSLWYISTPSVFCIPKQQWPSLAYAILIASCLGYFLLTWTSARTSASVVTAFWPFQVIPCFIASYFINGEMLSPLQYIGAVFVITGLFSVAFGRYLEEAREEKRENTFSPLKAVSSSTE